jgi:hypothetical protein
VERVAFLVEKTGERIQCLLNPESVVARRSAGIRSAGVPGHRLTGAELTDDPVLFTGGGRTEIELDLLFDTSLLPGPATAVQSSQTSGQLGSQQADAFAGSGLPAPSAPVDVRSLTGPLWRLAENAGSEGAFGSPPLARFVWGKSWNVLGVISAIAERVEQFDPDGTPARSWLRLRLLRVGESITADDQPAPTPNALESAATAPLGAQGSPSDAAAEVAHEVLGDGSTNDDGTPARGERLEAIAARYYPGQPWMWRFLAVVNDLDYAPWVPAGTVLRIPPAPDLSVATDPQ